MKLIGSCFTVMLTILAEDAIAASDDVATAGVIFATPTVSLAARTPDNNPALLVLSSAMDQFRKTACATPSACPTCPKQTTCPAPSPDARTRKERDMPAKDDKTSQKYVDWQFPFCSPKYAPEGLWTLCQYCDVKDVCCAIGLDVHLHSWGSPGCGAADKVTLTAMSWFTKDS